MEDSFIGGVTVSGMNNYGSGYGFKSEIKWEDNFTLRAAYAITYRYGRPLPFTMQINDTDVNWNIQNQAGPEQIETNPGTNYFAPHVCNITNSIQIGSDTLTVDFPEQQLPLIHGANWGYWGVYVVLLYTSPDITEKVDTRLYIADQSQVSGQSYFFSKPMHELDTPVLLSIFSSRLSENYSDASRIGINNNAIGDIWGVDQLIFDPGQAGVQGHFYYQNSYAEGLGGDTANSTLNHHDGIAVINNYLNNNPTQNLDMYRIEYEIYGGANPHPAFLITYTPSCPVSTSTMPREYTTCYQQSIPRGQPDKTDSLTLQALPGYDHYDWTPGINFNDSTLANPTLKPDSSGWYRVRMWSDDPAGLCAQTIPVFVTVGEVPRPGNLKVSATSCPAITGRIEFKDMAGQPPFQYTVNGHTQSSAIFDQLESGSYALSVVDHLGCTWDTTVVVPFSPPQQAAFTANPEAGYSPLSVSFYNESTNANSYQWLIDGEAFSTTKNTFYTFPDSGTYSIALVAYGSNTMCSDTAYITITVDQGLELIVPNIITPNGDGMNDALVAKIAGVRSMHWEVFNRWGNTLFSGDALKPVESYTLWSPEKGEYPAGVYTVVLTLEGNSGEVRKMAVQVMVK